MNHPGRNLRIGAVRYLNSRPLIECLPELLPGAEIVEDLPSRLADGLAVGRFDVALIPTVETLRMPGVRVISDACVSCDGPVRSVKLFSRVAPERITSLALDEGSRTSAVLARILLKERFRVEPAIQGLAIGDDFRFHGADAVVVIGDRAMAAPADSCDFAWDLGEQWSEWTGYPFVFAMWTARAGADPGALGETFTAARDLGLGKIEEIAAREAGHLGIPETECLAYLRESIKFRFGPRQRAGLELFARLAMKHRFVPEDATLDFAD